MDAKRLEDFDYKQIYREAIGKVDFEITIEAISNMHYATGYYKRINKRYYENKDTVSIYQPQW